MIEELIQKNRSYRRFEEDVKVELDDLKHFVDLGRQSASAANLQPLRYHISNNRRLNSHIFPLLKWAGYLKDWDGPVHGERPAAYITILNSQPDNRFASTDAGIAVQSILLAAVEHGYGGCIFASVDRERLAALLELPQDYKILFTIALGKPKEKVKLVEADDDIKYWRDQNGVHFVPKLKLGEVIFKIN